VEHHDGSTMPRDAGARQLMYVFQSPACGEKAASCMLAAWSLIVLHLCEQQMYGLSRTRPCHRQSPKAQQSLGQSL
jgi:hypothetical protein